MPVLMILLPDNKYAGVENFLKGVTINNLFARSVVERKVEGAVYADDENSPETFYVVHPYGMSLLFGKPDNGKFNRAFKDYALNTNKIRNGFEWMQAFPETWDNTLQDLFKDQLISARKNQVQKREDLVELNIRINFKFDHETFEKNNSVYHSDDIEIVRTDKNLFNEMKGSVVPRYFWNDADHFLTKGIGFSLLYKGKLASTAYSAFIHDDMLELGIETKEEFRGKGFAYLACVALIYYCLNNHFEPIWSCRLENIASYKLAQKLGFIPTKEIPYYRLCI